MLDRRISGVDEVDGLARGELSISAGRHSVEAKKRRGLMAALPFGLIVIAVGWTAAWFVLAGQIEAEADRWLSRETRAGRIHQCDERRIGGFPFRLEIICSGLTSTVGEGRDSLVAHAGGLHAVAQVYSPNHVIAEIQGPLEIVSPTLPGRLRAEFEAAQASYRGTLDTMERSTLVLDGLDLTILDASDTVRARYSAAHAEVHARRTPDAPSGSRDFDIALSGSGIVAGDGSEPTKLALQATLFALPERWRGPRSFFREWQARDGRLGLSALRLESGRMLAAAKGSLALDEQGRLEGPITTDVAGLEVLAARLARDTAGLGSIVGSGLALSGEPSSVEGRKAVRLDLTLQDGSVRLGAIPIVTVPALY